MAMGVVWPRPTTGARKLGYDVRRTRESECPPIHAGEVSRIRGTGTLRYYTEHYVRSSIRYIEVASRNWWPGNKVLVSPAWVERVSWPDSKVYVGLSREAIKNGPEYAESMPITREYENQLYFHYGRPPYWLHEAQHQASVSQSGV